VGRRYLCPCRQAQSTRLPNRREHYPGSTSGIPSPVQLRDLVRRRRRWGVCLSTPRLYRAAGPAQSYPTRKHRDGLHLISAYRGLYVNQISRWRCASPKFNSTRQKINRLGALRGPLHHLETLSWTFLKWKDLSLPAHPVDSSKDGPVVGKPEQSKYSSRRNMNDYRVSVIIPTKNRCTLLRSALESARELQRPRIDCRGQRVMRRITVRLIAIRRTGGLRAETGSRARPQCRSRRCNRRFHRISR
jgi:hypothetical protein